MAELGSKLKCCSSVCLTAPSSLTTRAWADNFHYHSAQLVLAHSLILGTYVKK